MRRAVSTGHGVWVPGLALTLARRDDIIKQPDGYPIVNPGVMGPRLCGDDSDGDLWGKTATRPS
jgi:hypothetical protein